MSAPRDVLERAFPAPGDAFDRLIRRRERRDRRRRLVDGGVAILLVVMLVAALIEAIADRRQEVPAGPIMPSNVGALGLAWWGPTVPAASQPVVAGDRVYVLSQDGTLSAFPSECPSERCDPVWSARSGIGSSRPWGSAMVSDGRVYQPSSDGRLVGYPTSCETDPCEPNWIGRASGDLTSANPVAGDGSLFVASDGCCHGSRSYGRLFAFHESCASYPTPCRPSWTASLPSGFIGAQPVVGGGRVYVGALDGTVYGFPIHCAPARGRCEPLWTAETHGRYAANFGFGLPLHSLIATPLIANGSTLYVAAGSSVYAFPLACRTSPCPPEWIGHVGGWINDIAVSSGYLYASAEARVEQGQTGFRGGTVVFPTPCANRCRPVWTFESGQSSPIVADGVLYLLGSGTPGDQAFDASCGRGGGGGACDPLWTMSADNGGSVDLPSITNDAVYVSGTDGNLHVFRLGGSATCCVVEQGIPGSRNPLGYLLFYGPAAAGIVWLVARRRARARVAL